MRTIITFAGILVGTLSGWSQGTVLFANRVVQDGFAVVDAPIYYFGFGTERLAGERFKAQLIVERENSALQPVGTPVSFLTGAAAGYFDGGVLSIDSIAPGTRITAQVFAWDSTTGSPFGPTTIQGRSQPLILTTGALGDPSAPPAIMYGLGGGFSLIVPEPPPVALGGLAAGIFVIFRWFRRASKTIGG